MSNWSSKWRNKPHVNANSGTSDNPQSDQTLFGHGVLHVEIFKAKGIKGDEVCGVGKADPYLKVEHGTASNRVTVSSKHHQDAGSNPEWNTRFKFPLRNGGTPEHNILEIEIWNQNKFTRWGRDNCLGHIRIGGLASWIERHTNLSTPEYWYPIFYKSRRSSKDQTDEQKWGEILMRFYFSKVEPGVFAKGHETEVSQEKIQSNSGSSALQPHYRRVEGNTLSSVLGKVGPYVSILPTLLIFFFG